MDDKILVATIAAFAAILGVAVSGLVQYFATRRKAQSDELKVGMELLKDRIRRLESINQELSTAIRTPPEQLKDDDDGETRIALSAFECVKIGKRAIEDHGHLFPVSRVQRLKDLFAEIDSCRGLGAENLTNSEADPIEMSFTVIDEIQTLVHDELRSSNATVDKILKRSVP